MTQGFTRTAPAPDPTSALTAIRAVIGDPFTVEAQLLSDGTIAIAVDKPTAWTGPQTSQVQTAITIAAASSKPLAQQADIDVTSIREKSMLLTMLDQINVIRQALPSPLPVITPAQALAAWRTKAGTL